MTGTPARGNELMDKATTTTLAGDITHHIITN